MSTPKKNKQSMEDLQAAMQALIGQGKIADIKSKLRTDAYAIEMEREEDLALLCKAFPQLEPGEKGCATFTEKNVIETISQHLAD